MTTTHHVTAQFNPGESRLVIDGVDVSRLVTKTGTAVTFNPDGQPVLTVRTAPGVTMDLDLEHAAVVVNHDRPLRALDILAGAGMEGDDAVTSLDTFILRAARHVAAEVASMSDQERLEHLTRVFGSDAVRVAHVLTRIGA